MRTVDHAEPTTSIGASATPNRRYVQIDFECGSVKIELLLSEDEVGDLLSDIGAARVTLGW